MQIYMHTDSFLKHNYQITCIGDLQYFENSCPFNKMLSLNECNVYLFCIHDYFNFMFSKLSVKYL